MIHTIILNRKKHAFLLADHRFDPVTKKLLEVGDEVVVCAKCKFVFLKDVWTQTLKGEHCNQKETLNYIPSQSILDIEPKKSTVFPILFPWIVTIIVGSILFANINNLKEKIIKLENKVDHLNGEKVELEHRIFVNSSDKSISELKSELNKYQSSIKNFYKTPIIIKDIDFQSTNNNRSKTYIKYGESLRRSKIYYLCPRITYDGISTSKKIKLSIKIINPDGSLKSNSKTSPPSFTYDYEFTCNNGQNEKNILGWGNSSGGVYTSGWHQIEIWYNKNCIGLKKFYINGN